jgi:hypothetical protein
MSGLRWSTRITNNNSSLLTADIITDDGTSNPKTHAQLQDERNQQHAYELLSLFSSSFEPGFRVEKDSFWNGIPVEIKMVDDDRTKYMAKLVDRITNVVKIQQWEKPPLFAAKKHNQGFQLGLYPDTGQQPTVFVPIKLPWGDPHDEKNEVVTDLLLQMEQLKRDNVEIKQKLLEPRLKRQKIPYEELRDVSNVIDINSDDLRGQMKECFTALSKSVTSGQPPWNILNITPATLNKLKGISANAILKANSLEKHQCQQMSHDYLKVVALTSQENDACNMGYIDKDGGQFTVARRVPGGDQVVGSLSLALSLMSCVEIQESKNEIVQLEQKFKDEQIQRQQLEQRLRVLEETNIAIKRQQLVYTPSQHSMNMAVSSASTEDNKYEIHAANDCQMVSIDFNLPDWTCVNVNSVPCIIVDGKPYSSIYKLCEEAMFAKIHQCFRRKKRIHCITNDMISNEYKEQIRQHLGIPIGQPKFKLYKKSAVDNFIAEL